jgi:membrane protease YdiL (CAAX protease family)
VRIISIEALLVTVLGLAPLYPLSNNSAMAEEEASEEQESQEESQEETQDDTQQAPPSRTYAIDPRYDDRFGKSTLYRPNSVDTNSTFWKPLGSFLLPGLGQYIDGQSTWGLIYTGSALAGLNYASQVSQTHPHTMEKAKLLDEDGAPLYEEGMGLGSSDINIRKKMWGEQIYQTAGGFSAYHSFRTSVRALQKHGKYGFLTEEETPGDILMAPLNMSFMKRSTTYVPLAIGAALGALILSTDPAEGMEEDGFSLDDAFFASAFSLNAGTHEEAMFRGWIMPAFYEASGSELYANAGQSLIFAAAHLGSNSLPIPQLLLGYHLGSVTMERNWTLSEAVFIHTWWDIIAFATQYHYKKSLEDEEAAALITPVLWSPPLMMVF